MRRILDDPAVHGALVALGALAVLDTAVLHWALGWHRLNQAWSHEANLVAEVGLVLLGAAMLAAGLRARRR
jgi:uncharacterized membrane protein